MQEGGVLKTRGTAKKKEDFCKNFSGKSRFFWGWRVRDPLPFLLLASKNPRTIETVRGF